MGRVKATLPSKFTTLPTSEGTLPTQKMTLPTKSIGKRSLGLGLLVRVSGSGLRLRVGDTQKTECPSSRAYTLNPGSPSSI